MAKSKVEAQDTGTEGPDAGPHGEATRAPGMTTIAPGVLVRVAQLTALTVEGVAGMASIPGGVNRLFRKGSGEGVRIEIEDNTVMADLYLVMQHGVDVRAVSRQVQHEVARAMEEMVGMQVRRVDVHIEEIDIN